MIRMHRTGHPAILLQNPILGDAYKVRKRGALERSADGARYYYNKGIMSHTVLMTWDELRNAEKESLQDFFDNVAEGPKHKFNLIDHRGRQYRCWFNDNEIEFELMADVAESSSTFMVDGEAEPTTQRRRAIWGVDVEMEILSTTTTTTTGA